MKGPFGQSAHLDSGAGHAAEVEAEKAKLRDEFPEWSIIYTTDTGRWWANRGPLLREDLGSRSSADADTPDGLRRRIRELAGPEK